MAAAACSDCARASARHASKRVCSSVWRRWTGQTRVSRRAARHARGCLHARWHPPLRRATCLPAVEQRPASPPPPDAAPLHAWHTQPGAMWRTPEHGAVRRAAAGGQAGNESIAHRARSTLCKLGPDACQACVHAKRTRLLHAHVVCRGARLRIHALLLQLPPQRSVLLVRALLLSLPLLPQPL